MTIFSTFTIKRITKNLLITTEEITNNDSIFFFVWSAFSYDQLTTSYELPMLMYFKTIFRPLPLQENYWMFVGWPANCFGEPLARFVYKWIVGKTRKTTACIRYSHVRCRASREIISTEELFDIKNSKNQSWSKKKCSLEAAPLKAPGKCRPRVKVSRDVLWTVEKQRTCAKKWKKKF